MALLLAASVSVTVPHAEAATRPGLVTALKQQLNGHGGVRYSSVSRTVWGPKKEHVTTRSRTVYKLGGGKVVAVDFSFPKSSPGGASRTIAFPDRSYIWEQKPLDRLPAGKSWILDTKKNDLYLWCGQIRLSNPATLRHVLATTATKRPAGVYEGAQRTEPATAHCLSHCTRQMLPKPDGRGSS
ncbi:hypothetical protein ACTMTF_26135 [Nonomuraea sp. ZG12]|uniref:hypothetical protein n=1 Tax=Nonomuraea sp. ZG12 TaxID=3452207 RepID=UPI003F897BEE